MSERSTLKLLERVHDMSATLLEIIGSGSNPTAEAARMLRDRQAFVEQLAEGVEEVTPQHRELACAIAQMDARIMAWCQERQAELANKITNRPRRRPPANEAKIVYQIA